jgi:hypothetical protein
MKKIITIAIIVLILIGVGVGMFFFLNADSSENGTPREGNFFGSLFGGGDGGSRNVIDDDLINNDDSPVIDGNIAQSGTSLQQLTNTPIAAAVIVAGSNASATPTIRYIDRLTGNILGIDLRDLDRSRFSNTTILGVREGVWSNDGNNVVLRYLDNSDVIRSFAGEVSTTSVPVGNETELPLAGGFLDNDLPAIVTSPDGNRILYLQFARRGVAGYRASFNGDNRVKVFESEFSEWIMQWINDSTISLTTKASGLFPGFLYFVNTSNGDFKKVLGDINGLTTNANKDGSKILYSESSDGKFTTHVFTPKTNASEQVTISTLPEKCVWSNTNSSVVYCGVPTTVASANYPDQWYQGIISFSDEIWRYDIEGNIGERIASPTVATQRGIDLINPLVSLGDDYLIFTNKKDSTLWSLRLQ